MPTALLIPVKNLSNAKQRLGEAFDQEHRSLLAEAMLRDVLTVAAGVADRLDLYLVTGDAQARRLRAAFGFGVIEDTRNESETAAIEMATAWCEERGYDTAVVLPGDVPLTTSAELRRVLDSAPEEGAVFVPAYDRRGSNCILRRPASIIPLRFGDDSFLPHLAAARAIGIEPVIVRLPGIGLDIDQPRDVQALLRAGPRMATRAVRLLEVATLAAPPPTLG